MNHPALLHAATIAAACTLFVLALAVGGPALDAVDEARASAASLAQAEHAARQQARLRAALAALCGENAAAIEVADSTYRCATKRGFKTALTARVQL